MGNVSFGASTAALWPIDRVTCGPVPTGCITHLLYSHKDLTHLYYVKIILQMLMIFSALGAKAQFSLKKVTFPEEEIKNSLKDARKAKKVKRSILPRPCLLQNEK